MELRKRISLAGIVCFSFLTLGFGYNSEAAELKIMSTSVSTEKEAIAKESWKDYTSNYLIDTVDSLDDYYLGEGFNVDNWNVTDFPVIKKSNKEISFVLQIDQDNQILLSKKLGNELNDLSLEKVETTDEPISITGGEKSLYYQNSDGQNNVLIGEKEATSPEIIEFEDKENIDISEVLDEPNETSISPMATFDHVVLPWTTYEIQGKQPWCEWYSIAGVLNNLAKKNVTSAEKLIKGIYPKATSAQLSDTKWITSLNLYDTFNYLKTRHNVSVILKQGKPSLSEVKREINTRKAPFVVDLEAKDGAGYGHAIVQIGYTASSSTANSPYYYYWNPWWEDTFVVSSTASYLQLSQSQFVVQRFSYNYSIPKI